MNRSIPLAAMLAASLVFVTGPACAAGPLPLAEFAKPGRVLLLRHAHAPGFGDPANFELRDCSSQRNLDATGRAQAAELGRRLAQSGVAKARIYSSQWCRCLETARLLDMGPVEELAALNSFVGRPQDRDRNLGALRAFLAKLPTDGTPVVLVTHHVTIGALTDRGAVSGGGVILALDGTGQPPVLGEFEAN